MSSLIRPNAPVVFIQPGRENGKFPNANEEEVLSFPQRTGAALSNFISEQAAKGMVYQTVNAHFPDGPFPGILEITRFSVFKGLNPCCWTMEYKQDGTFKLLTSPVVPVAWTNSGDPNNGVLPGMVILDPVFVLGKDGKPIVEDGQYVIDRAKTKPQGYGNYGFFGGFNIQPRAVMTPFMQRALVIATMAVQKPADPQTKQALDILGSMTRKLTHG